MERFTELHTEFDPVLIELKLRRRRSARTLLKERVSSENRDGSRKVVGSFQIYRERFHVDLGRLPAGQGVGDDVRGADAEDQSADPGRNRKHATNVLGIGRSTKSARHTDTP